MPSADRKLRATVDALEPRVRAQVERALASLRASLDVSEIERAIAARDVIAIHDIAASLPRRLRPALDTLRRAFAAGQKSAIAALPTHARFSMRFDATSPFAVEAARRHAAELVVDVTNETRSAIRSIVARSFEEGIPPREAAKLIRPIVGLTKRQAESVASLRTSLIERGFSRTAALSDAKRYADRLLKLRAMTIARTETIAASSTGQLEAWRDAVNRGLIGSRSKKVWIVTPDDRLCPRCRPLDGKQIALEGSFDDQFGATTKVPPLHPNCRCAVGLVPETVAGSRRRRRAA